MEENIKDTYLTIKAPSAGLFRDRGSKFLAYAYPACSEEEAMEKVALQRAEHPKARHHCYAYRIGTDGNSFRANDDGEPGGTAGRPILGQIDSFGVTNVVVVVVRYFGGTKLGASGLINAYKTSAAEALRQADIVERTLRTFFELEFGYDRMGAVMSAVERTGIEMTGQDFGPTARISIAIRKSEAAARLDELKAHIAGVSLDEARQMGEIAGVAIREARRLGDSETV